MPDICICRSIVQHRTPLPAACICSITLSIALLHNLPHHHHSPQFRFAIAPPGSPLCRFGLIYSAPAAPPAASAIPASPRFATPSPFIRHAGRPPLPRRPPLIPVCIYSGSRRFLPRPARHWHFDCRVWFINSPALSLHSAICAVRAFAATFALFTTLFGLHARFYFIVTPLRSIYRDLLTLTTRDPRHHRSVPPPHFPLASHHSLGADQSFNHRPSLHQQFFRASSRSTIHQSHTPASTFHFTTRPSCYITIRSPPTSSLPHQAFSCFNHSGFPVQSPLLRPAHSPLNRSRSGFNHFSHRVIP